MRILPIIAILITITCIGLGAKEAPTQLKNIESEFVLLESIEGEIRFHDPLLKEEMETKGVSIPLQDRERYGGKEHIFLGDKQFLEAFQEFYYTYQLNSHVYKWE
jgi:hypothetical protein